MSQEKRCFKKDPSFKKQTLKQSQFPSVVWADNNVVLSFFPYSVFSLLPRARAVDNDQKGPGLETKHHEDVYPNPGAVSYQWECLNLQPPKIMAIVNQPPPGHVPPPRNKGLIRP